MTEKEEIGKIEVYQSPILKLIDEYRKDEVISLFAPSESGKTLLLLHEVSKFIKDGNKVLYIDTEGGIERMIEKWKPILESRFEIEFDKHFKIVQKIGLENLMAYLGLKIEFESSDDSVKKMMICQEKRGQIEKDIKGRNVLIVDSFTMPFREFDSNRVNFPVRADLIAHVFFKIVKIQNDNGLIVIFSHHQSKDPANRFDVSKIRGGEFIRHISKIIIFMERSFRKKHLQNYRKLSLVRFPNVQDWSKSVFVYIDDNGLRPVEVDELESIIQKND